MDTQIQIFISIALVLIFGSLFIYWLICNNRNKAFEKKEIQRNKVREKYRKIRQDEFEQWLTNLCGKYGEVSKRILFGSKNDEFNKSFSIFIFEKSKVVVLFGQEVEFKDIVNCEINDDKKIIPASTDYSYETKTSTGSMLGRAAVGAFLGGGVGAVIGASTAKKSTVIDSIDFTPERVFHNYTLIVTISDLSSPLIKKKFHDSLIDTAEEFCAIIKVITTQHK